MDKYSGDIDMFSQAGRCSAQEYFALLKESKGPVIRDKLLEDWRQSLVILGDGLDYFRAAMVECSSDFPEAGFTTFYVKNQGDLDWEAIGNELELPADLRWGNGQEGLSDNWLSFSTEKVITCPKQVQIISTFFRCFSR
jgi:hypothetical protein